MAKLICTVPDTLSGADILRLESAFRNTYREHFGENTSLMVLWYRLPPGQSYVAGEPGDVFIAMIEVADGLAQEPREAAMLAFTRVFSEQAGIPYQKPLVSLVDASKVSEYLSAHRNRLRWWSRPGFLIGTLVHAFRSRQRDGFASLRANL